MMDESQGEPEPAPRLEAAATSIACLSHETLVLVAQLGLAATDLARLECTSRVFQRSSMVEQSAEIIVTEQWPDATDDRLDSGRMLAVWGRWLRVLHRKEVIAGKTNPLRFTKAGPGISIMHNGKKAAGMPPHGGYSWWGAGVCPATAICADRVMDTGVHSAEFTANPHCSNYMGIGVVRADWDPYNGGHASETKHGWAMLGAISGVECDDTGSLRHGSEVGVDWDGIDVAPENIHPCTLVNGKRNRNVPVSLPPSTFSHCYPPTCSHVK